MGNPDMRTPITYSMAWPERIDSGVEPLDLFQVGQLNFKEPDLQKFPCLRIAQEVATQGGTSSAIMNAANEIAVDSFLNKQIHYTDIAKLIEKTLEKTPSLSASSIENILKSDEHARHITKELITCL
jgi:1-deoxy-D-xylulose-5-phosphate reductoisomerase